MLGAGHLDTGSHHNQPQARYSQNLTYLNGGLRRRISIVDQTVSKRDVTALVTFPVSMPQGLIFFSLIYFFLSRIPHPDTGLLSRESKRTRTHMVGQESGPESRVTQGEIACASVGSLKSLTVTITYRMDPALEKTVKTWTSKGRRLVESNARGTIDGMHA